MVLAGRIQPGFGARERLDRVAATWYYDYTPRLDDEPSGYHKAAMLRGGEANRVDLALVAEQARRQPGHAWLIFNEPDLEGQDRVSEAFLDARGETRFAYYARLLHEYAITIRSADPTAQLVGPNLFNSDGRGVAWLRSLQGAYRDLYGGDLPFDVLGVHLYAFDPAWKTLPQIDLTQNERFLAEMLVFASTLPRHPRLWVTEVGSLWIYSDLQCAQAAAGGLCNGSRVEWDALSAFTTRVVQTMSAAGVERWFFFSTNPTVDSWASAPNATFLADERNQLTAPGQAWVNARPLDTQRDWAQAVLSPQLGLATKQPPG